MKDKFHIEDEELKLICYPVGCYIQSSLRTIKIMADHIKEKCEYKPIVNLICQGSSGAIIAAIIANEVPNSHIIYVRKSGENSHSDSYEINRIILKGAYNIFIDDRIQTGKTMRRLYKACQSQINIFRDAALPDLIFKPDLIAVTGSLRMDDLQFPFKETISYKFIINVDETNKYIYDDENDESLKRKEEEKQKMLDLLETKEMLEEINKENHMLST